MPVRNNKDLGEAIRSMRLKKGMQQVELARYASIRQATLSALENGVMSARLTTILKVLAALDLDLSIIPRDKTEFDPRFRKRQRFS